MKSQNSLWEDTTDLLNEFLRIKVIWEVVSLDFKKQCTFSYNNSRQLDMNERSFKETL